MTPRTIAEKILSRTSGRPAHAGDFVVCSPDLAMGTDGSVPMALDGLAAMQREPAGLSPASRFLFALDHYGPTSGPKAQALQSRVREFARRHAIQLVEVGEGIGHQVLLERGLARPGALIVGADSHAVTYGAVNALATGVGSSDLAGVMLCGQLWLRVPESVRVELRGALARPAGAKDVALHLVRAFGAGGANDRALEFCGPGVASLDMDDRMVLANMSVEAGAMAGIFPCDGVTTSWLAKRGVVSPGGIAADPGAGYADSIDVDLRSITSQVALPHRVDSVVADSALPRTKIDLVYLGTCTGGRFKDYADALEELRVAGGVAPHVKLVVTPASAEVEAKMRASGLLAEFERMGAIVQPPGCGSCCGTAGVVPGDGDNVLSTANRNFRGRMGNGKASIFLASPRLCGRAAASGFVGSDRTGPPRPPEGR